MNLGQNTEGGPVLLVDAADCCGGGAAGDSVATLRVLLELAPNQRALVPVADAAAAAAEGEAAVATAEEEAASPTREEEAAVASATEV